VSVDFDKVIGDDVGGAERERLRKAHDALLVAGPPPELPAGLAEPRTIQRQPRRLLLLAAAVAIAAAFFGGWLAGGAGGADPDFSLAMHGTGAARAASATLDVYPIDEAGNWPMHMTLSGLPEGRYELVLTRAGRPAVSCGFFLVHGKTEATLNAPYKLRTYDGWAVVRPGSPQILLSSGEI